MLLICDFNKENYHNCCWYTFGLSIRVCATQCFRYTFIHRYSARGYATHASNRDRRCCSRILLTQSTNTLCRIAPTLAGAVDVWACAMRGLLHPLWKWCACYTSIQNPYHQPVYIAHTSSARRALERDVPTATLQMCLYYDYLKKYVSRKNCSNSSVIASHITHTHTRAHTFVSHITPSYTRVSSHAQWDATIINASANCVVVEMLLRGVWSI